MQGLPFEIPQSLGSYLTQFDNDPEKGIANLEALLKKRGLDAVGFFLLSWLYHNNHQKEKAIHYALKAKCCAPGSPFFEHLHYFMVHPDHFQAWKPFSSESPDAESAETAEEATPGSPAEKSLNLDRLIEQLSLVEKKKIAISIDEKDDRNLGEKSEKVGDIASETLATIYEKQKKYGDALRTLNKLCQTRPKNADFYQSEIKRIQELMNRDEKSRE